MRSEDKELFNSGKGGLSFEFISCERNMKIEYKIFFAIPFDTLTKNVYGKVSRKLRDYFDKKGYKLTTVIGSEQIGPSFDYSDILTFRTQNTELHRQFLKEISASDIIIADLTNNNPNVHVELGVALTLNKNILRVTGREVSELGFDIQSFKIDIYTNEDDLLKKIIKYIEVFFKIKKLNFSEENKSLYRKIPETIVLPGAESEIGKDKLWSYPIKDFLFRDGAIKLEVEFVNCLNDKSWIGVYFRLARHFYLGSCLMYIRKNGFIELAEYDPNLNVTYKKQCLDPIDLNAKIDLLLQVENNQVEVRVNGENFTIPELKQQRNGGIMLATYECRTQFKNLELINRDTIEM